MLKYPQTRIQNREFRRQNKEKCMNNHWRTAGWHWGTMTNFCSSALHQACCWASEAQRQPTSVSGPDTLQPTGLLMPYNQCPSRNSDDGRGNRKSYLLKNKKNLCVLCAPLRSLRSFFKDFRTDTN